MLRKSKCLDWVLLAILAVGFGLRLYRLDYPLMDWHSFRQADTVSVTQEFIRHHYPIWLPHYHDLGNVQSGQDNLEGYRMVEFPIVNYVLAEVWQLLPEMDLVMYSRVWSVLVSVLSLYLFYLLVKLWQSWDKVDAVWRETASKRKAIVIDRDFSFIYQDFVETKLDERQQKTDWWSQKYLPLLATTVWAVMPYAVYYGRVILPEPYQVCCLLASLWFFSRYLVIGRVGNWYGAGITLALALLIKPTSIFWAPLFVWLAYQRYGWRVWREWKLWLLACVSLMPVWWWRAHIQNYPAGIPASEWLLNGNGIRLRPSWWRWLFGERLGKMMLGGWGVLVWFFGLWPSKRGKKKPVLTWFDKLTCVWLACIFVYLVVFATGNVQHDYYQFMAVPVVSLVLARGICLLGKTLDDWWQKKHTACQAWMLTSICLIILLTLSWWQAWQGNRGKFNVNNWDEVALGRVARELLPGESLVIANGYGGDTNFLWQTGHRGWPDADNIESKVEHGATYYLSVNRDAMYDYLLNQQCEVVYEDEHGFIFDLTCVWLEASSEATL